MCTEIKGNIHFDSKIIFDYLQTKQFSSFQQFLSQILHWQIEYLLTLLLNYAAWDQYCFITSVLLIIDLLKYSERVMKFKAKILK